jgi:predicted GNAT family acetyltransferase
MSADNAPVRVEDHPDRHRFVVSVDGVPAGFAAYQRSPGRIVFTHTEIDPAYNGRGLGSRLVAAALDGARAEGLAVVPRCPFVAAYISRHPEYVDLVH